MRMGTYYRYLVINELDLPVSGHNVLDVGCYDGFILSRIDANRKTGIDIEICRAYDDIIYIEDEFLRYQFKNEKFDLILAFDVLEHVSDDDKFLKKIFQTLSYNGLCIMSMPSKNIKIFPPILQSWIDKKWDHNYRRGYTKQELDQLIKRSCDHKKEINNMYKIIYWNWPLFRFLYLPLSLSWRISSSASKTLLKYVVMLDHKYQKGENGYLFFLVFRESTLQGEIK